MKSILIEPKLETISGHDCELKASEIIRGFNFKQVRQVLADGKGGYCVMGGLLKHFGAKDNDLVNGFNEIPKAITDRVYSKIGSDLNNKFNNWDDLVVLNNTGSDWNELADFLAQQGL